MAITFFRRHTALRIDKIKGVLEREVLTMKYSERMERLLDMYPEYRVVADELFEEGRQENNGEVALKLRKYGVDPEIIERCTGLDAEKLDKLAKEQL